MTGGDWGMDTDIWQTVSAPYSPSPEDWGLMRAACPPALLREDAAPRILALGVTPAVIRAPWPKGREIHAVDYDDDMIEAFWRDAPGAHCHCDYWQAMPLPDDHFDIVVGDCSFSSLPTLDDYDEVIREVVRVMKPGATLIARFFTQAEPRLSLAGLLRDAGERLADCRPAAARLLVAIGASDEAGNLLLRDIPRRIREQCGEVDTYLAALGQSPADIARAKASYEQDVRLNYSTESELRAKFAPYFSDIRLNHPPYDVGAHCPTVRLA